MSDFNGSIRTAKNDDASVDFTVRGSDFKVVHYSGSSDDGSLEECENGSTGDTQERTRLQAVNPTEQGESKQSIGKLALVVGGSVAVGLVGLIALPVAVGFWGVSGVFGKEETKEQAAGQNAEYSPDSRLDSPDTKASSQDVTPFKLEPAKASFKPMRGNLCLPPLKLAWVEERKERSRLAR